MLLDNSMLDYRRRATRMHYGERNFGFYGEVITVYNNLCLACSHEWLCERLEGSGEECETGRLGLRWTLKFF
jgi:hypothetical protein